MKFIPALLAASVLNAAVFAVDPSAAAAAVNEFGIALHQRVAKSDKNLCLSPYSIQTALAMTYAGADGATRDEMQKVLRFGMADGIHESFAALRTALEKTASTTASQAVQARKYGGPIEPITLNVANRLFGQVGYGFKSPFKQLLERTYRAPLEELDFLRDAPSATKRINAWVEEQTRTKIRDLIPAGALDDKTRMVLVNAIYLKAAWASEFFEGSTKPGPFNIDGRDAKEVPMMQQRKRLGYAKRDGYSAVSLPYIGGEVHFVVLVPDRLDGLQKIEKDLTAATLTECAKLPARDVILHFPKFRLEPPTIPLGEALQAMGMKTAFDIPNGSANFEGMAARKPNQNLSISQVFHKTFLALDEKGTEAAAATAVAMAPASAIAEPEKPVEVRVDRPFLFAIQHRSTGACLFLGRVTDPR